MHCGESGRYFIHSEMMDVVKGGLIRYYHIEPWFVKCSRGGRGASFSVTAVENKISKRSHDVSRYPLMQSGD